VSYSIRVPAFEGPLDLLLHLIRTNKLDIRDIPIALIADQYLEHLSLMAALDLDVGGEFLVMAATLMEIKSRMLLPRPAPLAEGDDESLDPRAELVQRLLEYERFQQVAEQLRELAAASQLSFARTAPEAWEGGVPLVELQPIDLVEALRRMQAAEGETDTARPTTILRVRREAVNLRQRMAEVLRRVQGHSSPLPFSALLSRGEDVEDAGLSRREARRRHVLVTFLAVLELARLGEVRALQSAPFGEIYLSLGVASDQATEVAAT
jgi:segregation and condensation protein A